MSENEFGYGYEDDNPSIGGGLTFGLMAGVSILTKFEFNPNGGKEGAAQEALDIAFKTSGKDISYRMFPVTKAFDKGEEVTDVRHPAMKQAMKDFNSIIVHVLHAFVTKDAIKTALNTGPITSFQQFCSVARSILPQDFDKKPLDLFAQWQWVISGDNDKTYLRLPKNMKHGKWVCAHIPPEGGQWNEVRLNGALKYRDEKNHIHPFQRTKWFMDSRFAEQQGDETLDNIDPGAHETGTTPTPENWQ